MHEVASELHRASAKLKKKTVFAFKNTQLTDTILCLHQGLEDLHHLFCLEWDPVYTFQNSQIDLFPGRETKRK